jgi:sterol desaturase/sphingolipid hydroxylase (fatty acid hydroxylase superfamily)
MRHELAALFQQWPYLPLGALLAVRLVAWYAVERRWPAREVELRAVWKADLASSLFLFLVTIPLSDALTLRLVPPLGVPAPILALPLWVRLALYVVLADLGHYAVHRLLHTGPLWRFHRWHHAPEHMSWLAGNRQSLPDRFLVGLPYLGLFPLLGGAPWWLGLLLLGFAGLKNDWMHLNLGPRLAWLEGAIVTPRYHAVHHSVDPAHQGKNLGALFPWWDRLFSTQAPVQDAGALRYGLGERVPLARLVSGL